MAVWSLCVGLIVAVLIGLLVNYRKRKMVKTATPREEKGSDDAEALFELGLRYKEGNGELL